ncbi:hypothetical protein NX722_27715 [Endozoicomonas gorgoniicola]|uniref:Porin domain-containing protein n=1 Tax=Endozoicomonas gorgoniicola TaxID=1234144 RepID=A0ABT3N3Z7_9GAMM|nr:hypothetical protein [Endozoicomonas gorgoniicola]MCW7556353.1 hypothetical protein [Endozoicomonas gorgoniicola]
MSHSVSADEADQPDPADLTRPQTFIWVQGGGSETKADGKTRTGIGRISGGLSGQFSETSQYLGLLEQEFDKKGTANTRGRLFTTFDTGNSLVSKMGFSIDYIRHAKKKDTTTALGVIGKVETPWEWVSIYPNIAAVETETKKGPKGDKVKSRGYQFTMFTSLYLNEKGMYSMIAPEYAKLKDVTIKKVEVSLGAPITEDAKTWWDVKLTYRKNEGKKKLAGIKSDGTELLFGVSHYF